MQKSRKFQGKLHVGRRIRKQKNGDIYVLERTTRYDQETKKTLTVAQRLLGKIVAGTTEAVPTRRKRSRASAKATATRRYTGLTDILEHVGRVSGIDEDVRTAFLDGGTAEKILTVARYWLATGGQTFPRLGAWQAMQPTPCPGTVNGDVAGGLFKAVGTDEDGIQRYFRLREAAGIAGDTARFYVGSLALPVVVPVGRGAIGGAGELDCRHHRAPHPLRASPPGAPEEAASAIAVAARDAHAGGVRR